MVKDPVRELGLWLRGSGEEPLRGRAAQDPVESCLNTKPRVRGCCSGPDTRPELGVGQALTRKQTSRELATTRRLRLRKKKP